VYEHQDTSFVDDLTIGFKKPRKIAFKTLGEGNEPYQAQLKHKQGVK